VEIRVKSSRIHYAWTVLAVGTIIVFGALGLARFGFSLLLPSMQQDLGLDNRGAGSLATGNLVGYLSLSLIGGALASRYGPRRVSVLGMVVVGTGMLLTGTARSLWSGILWRTVTGLGSGASNVPIMALMSAWFSPSLRGLAAGIAVAGSSLALILTGPLVPRMLSMFPEGGWRIVWYIFGAISLIIACTAGIFLRNRPHEIGLQPLGNNDGKVNRGENELLKLRWGLVYKSPAVWHLGGVYAAFGFSYIIYITFYIRYLVGEILLQRTAAGNLFMLMGWCSVGCGLIWGTLSDRIGRKKALMWVFGLQLLSFIMFALWPKIPGLILSSVLFGVTAWSIPAIMAAVCGDVVGSRLAPAALGFVTLFFGIGQAFGPVVAGFIADRTGSFSGAFLVAGAVAFVGGFASAFLKPGH
jgi:MFS family permease